MIKMKMMTFPCEPSSLNQTDNFLIKSKNICKAMNEALKDKKVLFFNAQYVEIAKAMVYHLIYEDTSNNNQYDTGDDYDDDDYNPTNFINFGRKRK